MKSIEIRENSYGAYPSLSKRLTLMVGLACSCSTLVRADYQSEILSDNPLAYYRFNDGVAADAFDYAANLGSLGTSAKGVYSASLVRPVAGALVGSANTAGRVTSNGLTVPYQPGLNNQGSFSAEVWLKPSVIPTGTNLNCAMASWRENTDTFGREGWLIYQGADATGFNFRTYNKNAAAIALSINSGTGVTLGAWHHVVVTWDQAESKGRIYVNGVLKATSAVIAAGGTNSRSFDATTTANFTLGSRSDNAFPWSGDIDEPAYYPSVLSEAQIQAHYANGINPTPSSSYDAVVLADSPAAYWRLDEGTFVPTVAANAGSLGAAANGAYYNGSKNTLTGPDSAGGFLGFGTGNSALSLPNANGHVGTALSLLNNRPNFTVCGWLKRGANKSTNGGYFGQNDLFEFGDSAGTAFAAWNPVSGTVQAPYSIADDTWGFVAITGDSTSTKIYVNGEYKSSIGAANLTTSTPSYPFNIGGLIWSPAGQYFRGDIDEVAVFDKALSAGRVQQLYDTALGNVAPSVSVPTIAPGSVIPQGHSYTLTADPSGTPPFSYKWYRDGVLIPDATSKTYTVASAVTQTPVTAPFLYTVEVTNATSSTTSTELEVYISAGLAWTGVDGTNPSFWDIDTTTNWKTASGEQAAKYTDEYAVFFDNSATATAVAVQQDVAPQSVEFSNNAPKNYTFTGAFGITGPGIVTKSGTGTVELLCDNFYTGKTIINAGILKVGDGTTGSLSAGSPITLNGGALHLNPPAAATFSNSVEVAAAGQLAFLGTGNLTLSGGTILNAGAELFDRNGLVLVNGSNLASNATINSGEVAFTGNQEANRLASKAQVTVAPGAMMTIRGVNALPTGDNSVNPTLNQATLTVTSSGGSHAHLGNITLNGGSIVLDNAGGSGYNGESIQLDGSFAVTGTTPSFIRYGTGGNAGNSGVALNATKTLTVADVTSSPAADLTISAELENNDADPATSALVKAGPGTLYLADGVSHSYSGATTVSQGTLQATGSLAGPLVIEAAGTIAPGNGVGTFTAKDTTLSGRYVCDVNGLTADKLQVNGNLVLNAGSVVDINAISPTAPYYVICAYTGSLTQNGAPTVSGVPAGYSVVVSFNSIMIAQSGFSFSPALTSIPGSTTAALSSGNFDADNGGFTVSEAVAPQTDWTYTPGSWRSNGQAEGFGNSNVSYLISPDFTLTKSGVFSLSFAHRYSFEAGRYDGGVVEISINGGPYLRVQASSFSQNGYNGTVLADSAIPLANQQAFIEDSAGHPAFITSVCKAGVGKAGDVVKVRFMSASDNNTSGNLTPQGWEIDSYDLIEGGTGGAWLTWPVGVMQYSDNLAPPWTDLTGMTSPLFIDTTLAPQRFFRVKP